MNLKCSTKNLDVVGVRNFLFSNKYFAHIKIVKFRWVLSRVGLILGTKWISSGVYVL